MNYQTFPPQAVLAPLVKCYWTLEIPAGGNSERQRVVPDGCLEMAFILGDDIKRYTSGNDFILQPRAMVLGQTTAPFYIQPTGYVDTFAVRFYPYGFTNFVPHIFLKDLANKESPIADLFGERPASELEQKIIKAGTALQRIEIIETFLLNKLDEKSTVDIIVEETVNALLSTKGSASINTILKDDISKRRQLERIFRKQIGVSPKQLGKVIRLQAALKMLLNQKAERLTQIAYECEYYDQAHFIKDFKEFTGINPRRFMEDWQMALSSLFYTED